MMLLWFLLLTSAHAFERCEDLLRDSSPIFVSGESFRILDRDLVAVAQFGDAQYFIKGAASVSEQNLMIVYDSGREGEMPLKFPKIPRQKEPNCLSMTVAYAAMIMKSLNFETVLSSVQHLRGNSPLRNAWQLNPLLNNALFSNSMERPSLDLQSFELRQGIGRLNFEITQEQNELQWKDVQQRLARGEKMIFGGPVKLQQMKVYDLHSPRWNPHDSWDLPLWSRWTPDPLMNSFPVPSGRQDTDGGHAMLLVHAFETREQQKLLVFADTFSGKPLIISLEEANDGLKNSGLGIWIK